GSGQHLEWLPLEFDLGTRLEQFSTKQVRLERTKAHCQGQFLVGCHAKIPIAGYIACLPRGINSPHTGNISAIDPERARSYVTPAARTNRSGSVIKIK